VPQGGMWNIGVGIMCRNLYNSPTRISGDVASKKNNIHNEYYHCVYYLIQGVY